MDIQASLHQELAELPNSPALVTFLGMTPVFGSSPRIVSLLDDSLRVKSEIRLDHDLVHLSGLVCQNDARLLAVTTTRDICVYRVMPDTLRARLECSIPHCPPSLERVSSITRTVSSDDSDTLMMDDSPRSPVKQARLVQVPFADQRSDLRNDANNIYLQILNQETRSDLGDGRTLLGRLDAESMNAASKLAVKIVMLRDDGELEIMDLDSAVNTYHIFEDFFHELESPERKFKSLLPKTEIDEQIFGVAIDPDDDDDGMENDESSLRSPVSSLARDTSGRSTGTVDGSDAPRQISAAQKARAQAILRSLNSTQHEADYHLFSPMSKLSELVHAAGPLGLINFIDRLLIRIDLGSLEMQSEKEDKDGDTMRVSKGEKSGDDEFAEMSGPKKSDFIGGISSSSSSSSISVQSLSAVYCGEFHDGSVYISVIDSARRCFVVKCNTHLMSSTLSEYEKYARTVSLAGGLTAKMQGYIPNPKSVADLMTVPLRFSPFSTGRVFNVTNPIKMTHLNTPMWFEGFWFWDSEQIRVKSSDLYGVCSNSAVVLVLTDTANHLHLFTQTKRQIEFERPSDEFLPGFPASPSPAPHPSSSAAAAYSTMKAAQSGTVSGITSKISGLSYSVSDPSQSLIAESSSGVDISDLMWLGFRNVTSIDSRAFISHSIIHNICSLNQSDGLNIDGVVSKQLSESMILSGNCNGFRQRSNRAARMGSKMSDSESLIHGGDPAAAAAAMARSVSGLTSKGSSRGSSALSAAAQRTGGGSSVLTDDYLWLIATDVLSNVCVFFVQDLVNQNCTQVSLIEYVSVESPLKNKLGMLTAHTAFAYFTDSTFGQLVFDQMKRNKGFLVSGATPTASAGRIGIPLCIENLGFYQTGVLQKSVIDVNARRVVYPLTVGGAVMNDPIVYLKPHPLSRFHIFCGLSQSGKCFIYDCTRLLDSASVTESPRLVYCIPTSVLVETDVVGDSMIPATPATTTAAAAVVTSDDDSLMTTVVWKRREVRYVAWTSDHRRLFCLSELYDDYGSVSADQSVSPPHSSDDVVSNAVFELSVHVYWSDRGWSELYSKQIRLGPECRTLRKGSVIGMYVCSMRKPVRNSRISTSASRSSKKGLPAPHGRKRVEKGSLGESGGGVGGSSASSSSRVRSSGMSPKLQLVVIVEPHCWHGFRMNIDGLVKRSAQNHHDYLNSMKKGEKSPSIRGSDYSSSDAAASVSDFTSRERTGLPPPHVPIAAAAAGGGGAGPPPPRRGGLMRAAEHLNQSTINLLESRHLGTIDTSAATSADGPSSASTNPGIPLIMGTGVPATMVGTSPALKRVSSLRKGSLFVDATSTSDQSSTYILSDSVITAGSETDVLIEKYTPPSVLIAEREAIRKRHPSKAPNCLRFWNGGNHSNNGGKKNRMRRAPKIVRSVLVERTKSQSADSIVFMDGISSGGRSIGATASSTRDSSVSLAADSTVSSAAMKRESGSVGPIVMGSTFTHSFTNSRHVIQALREKDSTKSMMMNTQCVDCTMQRLSPTQCRLVVCLLNHETRKFAILTCVFGLSGHYRLFKLPVESQLSPEWFEMPEGKEVTRSNVLNVCNTGESSTTNINNLLVSRNGLGIAIFENVSRSQIADEFLRRKCPKNSGDLLVKDDKDDGKDDDDDDDDDGGISGDAKGSKRRKKAAVVPIDVWNLEMIVPITSEKSAVSGVVSSSSKMNQDRPVEMCKVMNTAGGSCIATGNFNRYDSDTGVIGGSINSWNLFYPVVPDLDNEWTHSSYFREFNLKQLVLKQMDDPSKDVLKADIIWPRNALITAFIWLSPTLLLLYRSDRNGDSLSSPLSSVMTAAHSRPKCEWIIIRINNSSVMGWPGRPLYHPLVIYEDMVCGNYRRVQRVLSNLHLLLKKLPEESKGITSIRTRMQVLQSIQNLFQAGLSSKKGSALLSSAVVGGDSLEEWLANPFGRKLGMNRMTGLEEKFDLSLERTMELYEHLTRTQLPLVSKQHTLTMLALAQSCHHILIEQQRNLDIPGSKFVFAANLYLMKRRSFIPSSAIAWALHSHAQEALLSLFIEQPGGLSASSSSSSASSAAESAGFLTYERIQQMGLAFWMKNDNELFKIILRMANDVYKVSKVPQDCMVWYLLLNKKQVFLNLLKLSAQSTATKNTGVGAGALDKMIAFFSRDFNSNEKNQDIASKNAFNLLGRGKIMEALSFSVLAQDWEMSLSICLQYLRDPHLALLITRVVYPGNGGTSPFFHHRKSEEELKKESLDTVIEQTLLPYCQSVKCNDVWLRHCLHWLRRKPEKAVQCLLVDSEMEEENNKDHELKNDGSDSSLLYGLSQAPEAYLMVSYLKENSIAKSVSEAVMVSLKDDGSKKGKKEKKKKAESKPDDGIMNNPLFAQFMGGDSSSEEEESSEDENDNNDDTSLTDGLPELSSPFVPEAYKRASDCIGQASLAALLRRAAVGYSKGGLVIHALECLRRLRLGIRIVANHQQSSTDGSGAAVTTPMLYEDRQTVELMDRELSEFESDLLFRLLNIRALVMEQSHHVEPAQTVNDFRVLSELYPKWDSSRALNLLYNECHLRQFSLYSCNIPAGQSILRLLASLAQRVTNLSLIVSQRKSLSTLERVLCVPRRTGSLEFVQLWRYIVDDLRMGVTTDTGRAARLSLAAIAHISIFIESFAANKYQWLEHQLFHDWDEYADRPPAAVSAKMGRPSASTAAAAAAAAPASAAVGDGVEQLETDLHSVLKWMEIEPIRDAQMATNSELCTLCDLDLSLSSSAMDTSPSSLSFEAMVACENDIDDLLIEARKKRKSAAHSSVLSSSSDAEDNDDDSDWLNSKLGGHSTLDVLSTQVFRLLLFRRFLFALQRSILKPLSLLNNELISYIELGSMMSVLIEWYLSMYRTCEAQFQQSIEYVLKLNIKSELNYNLTRKLYECTWINQAHVSRICEQLKMQDTLQYLSKSLALYRKMITGETYSPFLQAHGFTQDGSPLPKSVASPAASESSLSAMTGAGAVGSGIGGASSGSDATLPSPRVPPHRRGLGSPRGVLASAAAASPKLSGLDALAASSRWFDMHDLFKTDDIVLTLCLNYCAPQWLSIAHSNGLREIHIDEWMRLTRRKLKNYSSLAMSPSVGSYLSILNRFGSHALVPSVLPSVRSEMSLIFSFRMFETNPFCPSHHSYTPSESVALHRRDGSFAYLNSIGGTSGLGLTNNTQGKKTADPSMMKDVGLDSNALPRRPSVIEWKLNPAAAAAAAAAVGYSASPSDGSVGDDSVGPPSIGSRSAGGLSVTSMFVDDVIASIEEGKMMDEMTPSMMKSHATKDDGSSLSELLGPGGSMLPLRSTFHYSFPSVELSVPTLFLSQSMPSLGEMRRRLSNSYRFYASLIRDFHAQSSAASSGPPTSHGAPTVGGGGAGVGSSDPSSMSADGGTSSGMDSIDLELTMQGTVMKRSSASSGHQSEGVKHQSELLRELPYLVSTSHPRLPLYVTCNNKSDILLWHFMHPKPMAVFITGDTTTSLSSANHHSSHLKDASGKMSGVTGKGGSSAGSSSASVASSSAAGIGVGAHHHHHHGDLSKAVMASVKFNAFGNKMAAISRKGDVFLWHFNVPRSIYRREFRAHCVHHFFDKAGYDLCFMDHSSTLMSVCGESSPSWNQSSVCIVDLLMTGDFMGASADRCIVRAYDCSESGGANRIEYCSDLNCVVTGGSKSNVHLFDPRMSSPALRFHSGCTSSSKKRDSGSLITALRYFSPMKELLIGELDGSMSVWDLRKLCAIASFNQQQQQYPHHSLFTVGTTGVTGVSGSSSSSSSSTASMMYGSGMSGVSSTLSSTDDSSSTTIPQTDCSAAIVQEWEVYSKKTFVNHSSGIGQGLFASIGLTDAIYSPCGDILTSGSDGTVKLLKRKFVSV